MESTMLSLKKLKYSDTYISILKSILMFDFPHNTALYTRTHINKHTERKQQDNLIGGNERIHHIQ